MSAARVMGNGKASAGQPAGAFLMEGEKMEQTVLTAISAVGFPIVVTFYLLTRFQKSLDTFTAELQRLIDELHRQNRLTA